MEKGRTILHALVALVLLVVLVPVSAVGATGAAALAPLSPANGVVEAGLCPGSPQDPSFTLSGTVKNAAGAGVNGATVSVSDPTCGASVTGQSGRDGNGD